MMDSSTGATWFVTWGASFVHIKREGETNRDYFARIGNLHLRADGKLDMRYKSSKSILVAEAH